MGLKEISLWDICRVFSVVGGFNMYFFMLKPSNNTREACLSIETPISMDSCVKEQHVNLFC